MALDQATASFLAQLAEARVKPLPEMTPEEARGLTAGLRDLIGPGPDVAKSYDEQVRTPDGPPITDLSAVVAQRATAEGGPQLTAQVLIYPVTDADAGNGTYADAQNQLMLTRESMIWFWDHYAPDLADRANPGASPLRAADLAGLPPAIVLTAEYDVLREEWNARPTPSSFATPASKLSTRGSSARCTASSRW